jgi:hypothetical protein
MPRGQPSHRLRSPAETPQQRVSPADLPRSRLRRIGWLWIINRHLTCYRAGELPENCTVSELKTRLLGEDRGPNLVVSFCISLPPNIRNLRKPSSAMGASEAAAVSLMRSMRFFAWGVDQWVHRFRGIGLNKCPKTKMTNLATIGLRRPQSS